MSEITAGVSSPKLKLLFLDNSRTTRAAMSMVLKNHGYDVTAVASGPEAIEKVKTETFDAAIMDLYMPFMNGYEAAKIIRALPDKCKDIPMIALTASNDPRDMDIVKASGMNDFVVKSEDHKALFEVLERYSQQLAKPPSTGATIATPVATPSTDVPQASQPQPAPATEVPQPPTTAPTTETPPPASPETPPKAPS